MMAQSLMKVLIGAWIQSLMRSCVHMMIMFALKRSCMLILVKPHFQASLHLI